MLHYIRNLKLKTFCYVVICFVICCLIFQIIFLSTNERPLPTLVWWTPFMPKGYRIISCYNELYKCLITSNRSYITNANRGAYLFYGSRIENHDFPLPRDDTLWAVFHEESPKNYAPLLFKETQNLFNITSTFSRYSDIPVTLQYLANLDLIKDTKYCMTFIRLSQLDPLDLYNEELLKFISKYKFIIAFENAMCHDYITEKLWRPLIVGAIPIYLGSPTIQDWLPNKNSAVLVKDFETLKAVAEKIKMINEDDTTYESFLDHKLKLTVSNELLKKSILYDHPIATFECSVCKEVYEGGHYKYTKRRQNIYNCPKPKVLRTENTWNQHWELGKCQSKALNLLIGRNEPYSPELFDITWKTFLNERNC
ncbi:hypothetical protein NQ318_013170 [Aromia moschata]|uniref:Fucosyltransferase n=1 Tax=Aromia moschata TaxID=1265417 RepID=A0AAV8Y3W5_9CUCU|nr:hypothetical protein NQ318_013170 [Aromia moschata]